MHGQKGSRTGERAECGMPQQAVFSHVSRGQIGLKLHTAARHTHAYTMQRQPHQTAVRGAQQPGTGLTFALSAAAASSCFTSFSRPFFVGGCGRHGARRGSHRRHFTLYGPETPEKCVFPPPQSRKPARTHRTTHPHAPPCSSSLRPSFWRPFCVPGRPWQP